MAMSDSKCFNTSLLEVMISSKTKHVCIRDLRDVTLQIISGAWWALMNVCAKYPIVGNNSKNAAVWRFYLHWGMEENSSACGICIACHCVLRHPSDGGTSSMGKHLVTQSHIAKVFKSTESEGSELTCWMVDERALPIPKRYGSREITIVSLQSKFIFHN